MPDILIRGMKMPDSCEFCRFHGYGGYEFERVVCSLTGRSKEKPIFSRFDDCPFIGIPPHGDLIDRKELCDGLVSNHPVVIYANTAPVIVPASEEEANG